MSRQSNSGQRWPERGISLVLVALGLVMLLALAGLAIDLATLYVARNEAQRSADAAALAGAEEFLNTGATMGLTGNSAVATDAAQQAVQVGNANLIVGLSPNLDTNNFNSSCPSPTGVSGGCFNFSTQNDPQITVVVQQNLPTYFMKIFGITTVPVSATATAEAYNPIGTSGPSSTAECLKPWLLPNCDWDHMIDPTGSIGYEANTVCPASGGQYPAYFVYPQTQPTQVSGQPAIPAADLGQVVMPTLANNSANGTNTGGAIGEYLKIKPGDPSQAPAPSQFYPVFLPTPSSSTFECPSCATADKENATSNSAARYREFIECCSTGNIGCGSTTVYPASGNQVGPTGQGVQCLIHQGNGGSGQDTISFQNQTDPTIPYTMYAGANNPYTQPAGTIITTSDSLVTLPLYDGENLCPGNSCPASVSEDIQGMLQLFVIDVGAAHNTVYAYVLTISGCGGSDENGGGGTPTPVPSSTGSPIPVRLIHN